MGKSKTPRSVRVLREFEAAFTTIVREEVDRRAFILRRMLQVSPERLMLMEVEASDFAAFASCAIHVDPNAIGSLVEIFDNGGSLDLQFLINDFLALFEVDGDNWPGLKGYLQKMLDGRGLDQEVFAAIVFGKGSKETEPIIYFLLAVLVCLAKAHEIEGLRVNLWRPTKSVAV